MVLSVQNTAVYPPISDIHTTFSSGLLLLAGPLDYETQRVHRLTIRAVDHGQPPLSSTQTLTVEVGDVNDQAPLFEHSVYNATVAENRDPGEAVVRVSATDQDSGNTHSASGANQS